MKLVIKYLSLVLCVLAVMASERSAVADDATAQKRLVNAGIVSIISGGIRGTYVRIAADLSDALDDQYDLRVLPVIGKGSVRNIEDLLYLRGIDVAIVQSDVLDFYRRGELVPNIEQRIRYITKLYNEEVHVLAKSEFDSVDQLAGRRVNFGTDGSGTFMTSGIIFDDLGIEVEVTTLPEPTALEQLRAGEIDALVFVGGKPLALLEPVGSDEQLHLLAIPADRIKGAYVPAALTADTYPSLIEPDAAVPTVAVSAVMAAYNWPANHPRGQKVNRFIDRFFANFDRLMQPPFHPKWQEVNLAAEIPGWQRIRTLPDLKSDTAALPSAESTEAESSESTEAEIAKAETAEVEITGTASDLASDCAVCPNLVQIPAGRFVMGSEDGDASERPVHQVTIEQPFALGRYEVTVAQWQACVDAGACQPPAEASGQADKMPVHNVSWNEARAYASWLSGLTGHRYRLPSEAEWEYAARAGTATRFWWGDGLGQSNANCTDCGGEWDKAAPTPIGMHQPNGFGLHDMNGAVMEWVADCWSSDYDGAPANGLIVVDGNCLQRVLRGGSWRNDHSYVTSTSRLGYDADVRYYTHGFRVARDLN